MKTFDLSNVVSLLNRLLEARLLGVTRYTHYALMVSGKERITMSNFFTAQASECLRQAQSIGKLLIALNERPTIAPRAFHEPTGQHLHEMLLRTLHGERQALDMYQQLQRDRWAKSSFLQNLTGEMVNRTTMTTEQLGFMLQAHEPSVRAVMSR